MFCVSCGKNQPSNAAFCPYCGTKRPDELENKPRLTPPTDPPPSAASPIDQDATSITIDLPAGDLEPIFLIEKATWMFRHKSKEKPPPAWTQSTVDFMISEDFIVFQSTANITSMGETLKGLGFWAVVIAGSAVPIVGLPVALAAWAAGSAADPRKKKSAGYGKKNQLTRQAFSQRFIAGEAVWATKRDCEFRALRSRLVIDTIHYLAVIGKFHHISGVLDFAVFINAGSLYGADFKKDVAKRGDCVISRDEKFTVRSEALHSLEGYPEPAITEEFDDKWWK